MFSVVIMRYAGLVLQFGVLAVLARSLDPSEYGTYVLVLGIVLPTYFLMGLGTSEWFVRDVPQMSEGRRDRVPGLAGAVLVSVVATSCLACFAGAVLIAASVDCTAVLLAVALFLSAGWMFNGAQVLLALGAERWAGFYFYPALNIAIAAATVPVVAGGGSPDLAAVAVSVGIASILTGSSALGLALRKSGLSRPDLPHLRRQFPVGIKLAVARAAYSWSLWAPTIVAGVVLSVQDAGAVGTAGRLAVAVSATTAALRFVVRPAFARAGREGAKDDIVRLCARISTASTVLAAFAVVAVLVAGPVVLPIMFGPSMKHLTALLTVLLVGVLFEAVAGPADEVLKMLGHESTLLTAYAFTLPAQLAVLGLAAYVSGAVGLVAAQACYYGVSSAILIFLVRRHVGIWIGPRTFPVTPRRFNRVSR